MPELPEVQTVVSDLNEKIIGDTITAFWSEWPKAIKCKTLAVFTKEIVGRKILGVRRIGKNIFIDLSGNKTLYLHLKMTGHLLIKTTSQELSSSQGKAGQELSSKGGKDYFADKVNQYIRHKWTLKTKNHPPRLAETRLDSTRCLIKSKRATARRCEAGKLKTIEFSDVRKFAKIVLDDTDKIAQLPEIKSLGVDAISAEFILTKFNKILDRKAKSPIGIILMDQHLIAGIGNIYRSEILFEAGILPTRKAGTVSITERKKLFQMIEKIMQKAIKLRGTSDSDYRDTAGAPGGFQKIMKMYRHDGKKCPKCGTIIMRDTIGQRAVFFCPSCQK
jgi:formamidopyrimidine-DNA glycosylase